MHGVLKVREVRGGWTEQMDGVMTMTMVEYFCKGHG